MKGSILYGALTILGCASVSPAAAQAVSSGRPDATRGGTDASGTAIQSTTPLGSGTTAAPQADNASPGGLGDIIVTARRVAENLQDVPVAVTAFSGEALQQQNVRTLPEVANLTPGLTFSQAQTNQAAVLIQMRGQVQQDTLATIDPSVGTYVDGVYLARAYGLNSTLVDVQDFQALKGPQGTLFGRNTSGGAILINTNDPSFTDGLSGSISGSYGRFNHQALTGVLNAPLIDDVLAVRLVYSGNRRDGYVREINSGRMIQELHDDLFRAKVLLQPSESFRLLFSADRFRSNAVQDVGRLGYGIPNSIAAIEGGIEQIGGAACFPGGLAAGPSAACLAAGNQVLAQAQTLRDSRYRTSLSSVTRNKLTTETYSLTGTLDTSFGSIKAVGAYRSVNSRTFNNDSDASPVKILDAGGQIYPQRIKQWSGEVTATGNALADRLDFAAGVFYFHEYGDDATPSSTLTEYTKLSTGGTRIVTLASGDIDTKSVGVYGQATYHLSDQLSLTGGLRYSRDKKSLSSTTGNILGNSPQDPNAIFICIFSTGCPFSSSATFSGVAYTASVDYRPNEDILLYAKTAKGFRSGGQNLRRDGRIPSSLIPFKPEIVYNYELGVKSELFDRRVRINAAAYYTKSKDVQRNVAISQVVGGVPVTASFTENAAKVDIYGGELELSFLLPAGFRIDGTAAYTKPKYKQFIDQRGFDRSNEPFQLIPRWTASISPSWQGDVSFGQLNARLDFSYQAKQKTYAQGFFSSAGTPAGFVRDATSGALISDAAAAGFIDSITDEEHVLVNGRIGATFDAIDLDVALWGKNLTNLRDRVGSLPITGLGFARVILREPRTYGVTVTKRF